MNHQKLANDYFKSIRLITVSFLLTIGLTHSLHAQNMRFIDSLENQLTKIPKDSNYINILNKISSLYWESKPEKTNTYAKKAENLSKQLNYQKGIGDAYRNYGLAELQYGNPKQTKIWFEKCLALRLKLGNKKDIANAYRSMVIVYTGEGNNAEAMKCLLIALKINEEINYKLGIASCYRGLGDIYDHQGNLPESKKYYEAFKTIAEEIGDSLSMTAAYGGLAGLAKKSGEFEIALKYLSLTFPVSKRLGDISGVGYMYNSMSEIYYIQKNYNEAVKTAKLALHYFDSVKEFGGNIWPNLLLSKVYIAQNNLAQSRFHLNIAFENSTGLKGELSSCYHLYSKLDSANGDYKKAYENFKLATAYHDSLTNNKDLQLTTEELMKYDFNKLQVADSIRFQQSLEISSLKLERQKSFTYLGLAGILVIGIFLFWVNKQRNAIAIEKKRSEELLLNILPYEVAEELKKKGSAEAKHFDEVSVMFTDFKDFTKISESLSPKELVAEIDYCFREFDRIILHHKIEKIKTIGDSYMCAAGLSNNSKDAAVSIIKAAIQIRDFIERHSQERTTQGKVPFQVRIGIHTGPVVAGIVGLNKFAYDIWGDTVNTASRMESHSHAGRINISAITYDLIKDKFECTPRGKIAVKGKGEIEMWFV